MAAWFFKLAQTRDFYNKINLKWESRIKITYLEVVAAYNVVVEALTNKYLV